MVQTLRQPAWSEAFGHLLTPRMLLHILVVDYRHFVAPSVGPFTELADGFLFFYPDFGGGNGLWLAPTP